MTDLNITSLILDQIIIQINKRTESGRLIDYCATIMADDKFMGSLTCFIIVQERMDCGIFSQLFICLVNVID